MFLHHSKSSVSSSGKENSREQNHVGILVYAQSLWPPWKFVVGFNRATMCLEVYTARNLSLYNFHLDKVPSKLGYDVMSCLAATCFWMGSKWSSPGIDIDVTGAEPSWMNKSKDVSTGSYPGSCNCSLKSSCKVLRWVGRVIWYWKGWGFVCSQDSLVLHQQIAWISLEKGSTSNGGDIVRDDRWKFLSRWRY